MTSNISNDQIIEILISIHRDTHDNGMTVGEYADAVISGTHPILEHDDFVYQFGARQEDLSKVITWATKNSLTVNESDICKSLVRISGSVGNFNSLFNITLHTVTDNNRTYMSHSGTITIPNEIIGVVEQVLGFDQTHELKSHALHPDTHYTGDPTPNPVPGNGPFPIKNTLDPIINTKAYNIPSGSGYGQTIGILCLLPTSGGWNQTDINLTFNRVGGFSKIPTPINYPVNGIGISSFSQVETVMDIWCSGGVVPWAQQVIYAVPTADTSGLLAVFNAILADNVNNPSIISVSLGFSGESVGDFLATTFQALVAKGILIFNSSGDDGAESYVADYPGTSNYVVCCGGTSIWVNGDGSLNTQTSWSGSGGGISTIISRPSWQTTPPIYSTTYSTGGVSGSPTLVTNRGTPDISAPGDPYTGYEFYVNSALNANAGTSAAAPLLAGIIARLQQLIGRRIGLGELMTLLYNNIGTATFDVGAGSNNWNWNGGNVATDAYQATPGWDACTGTGTPNGAGIYKLLHKGATYPKQNYGFRPTNGASYPRISQGARKH